MKKISVLALVLIVTGCSSVELTESARRVKIVESVSSKCESLGLVAGEGGSSWKGGGWYKNSTLLEYAQNDMKNKAAALGATHVVIKSSNFGETHSQYGGTVTGANLNGTAYRCK